ncbi:MULTISPECIES: AzlD domain-containing protein [Priestia]|uniref:AzlD domain-containing protein n=1 Tax=Priestia TaxID=2800373 RepID=UPI002040C525|nr:MULTISPECIES: AzlD domain-containing protein [Priestia]MCM3770463.1 AzlD domain-containing protein [Priestia aryabhattai]MDY0940829.1 AzlD domain-containing protein [Priestia megaterium]
MSIHYPTLIIILGCALVTVVPRIVPFLVVRNIALPEPILKWLSYIPICILTALVVENFIIQTNDNVKVNWPVIIVVIPTLLIALKTKSLSITVISGVGMMALLRFFLLS